MELIESYITDEKGNIKSVILDYKMFKKLEEFILDLGLANAMNQIADDEEIDIQEAMKITGFKDDN